MLVNYFLFLMVLLLVSGLALDTGLLEWRQLHLQNAADAAAQEAAYQYARSDGAWAAEGKAQAASNGFTDGSKGVTVSVVHPPTSTPWAGDAWSVQATVSQSVNNVFMSLINAGKSTVAATAVARVLPTCIWVMNPSGNTSAAFSLASAGVYAPCGLYVNTATGSSMGVDFFATLSNLRNRVVGQASGSYSTGTVNPQPRYTAASKNDPLAYVTAPLFHSCTSGLTNFSVSGGSKTINPGTYCGGITLNNASVTLTTGLYIITGGLTMTNSFLYGTSGVTLYFTQGGGYGFGSVNITGTYGSAASGVYLKAPVNSTSGGIPGIAIFGDRNWVTHCDKGVDIEYTQIQTDGIWYLPNTGIYLWITGFTFYTYNGLVVDNFYLYGATATFHTDYTNLGGIGPFGGTSPYHYEDAVLVQ